MGGLNKTIHFDFLIKALNKKIRADCLIEENAPEPVVTPTAGDMHQGVQQGPRTLGNSRIRGPSLYAFAYTLTPPENSESAVQANAVTSRRA